MFMSDQAKVKLLSGQTEDDGHSHYEDVTAKLLSDTVPGSTSLDIRDPAYFEVNSDTTSVATSPIMNETHDISIDIPDFPISTIQPRRGRAIQAICRFGSSFKNWFDENIGLLLFAAGQLFSSTMNLFTRILETTSEPHFHALQIVFTRMMITAVACTAYMWYTKVCIFFYYKGVNVY